MKPRSLLVAFVVCTLAFAADSKLPEPSKALDGFDSFAAEMLKTWKVPGAAVVIFQDGKAVLKKGYGLRDVKGVKPVTPQTLFAIGSATKSFVVLGLGLLADEGKLSWDRPVREYLPAFRLAEETASEHMTPRDLVTHRSGLPRHDMLWYNSPFSREQIIERLRYLPLSKEFRSLFQYNNLMFMTAGYLFGKMSGADSWEQATRKRILEPLGMAGTNLSVEDSKRASDFALPYKEDKEVIVEVPFRNIDNIGPAGSINSNLEDMSKYLLLQMGKGKVDGKAFVAASNLADMHRPQMVIPGATPYKEVGHSSYGMGWFITSYRGHKLVHHGGNIDGFSALVAFLPDDNIGLVVLTNKNGTPLPSLLSYNAYDRLLGLEPVGWSARLKEQEAKGKAAEKEAEAKKITPRKAGTTPSHPIAEYAGDYEHPGYGTLSITRSDDALQIRFNQINGRLKHFHYDVFEVAEDIQNPLSKGKVQFQTNMDGEIDSVLAPVEPALKAAVFQRKGDTVEPAVLQMLTGSYTVGPQTAVVVLRDGRTLTLTLPGQPVYELVPTRGLKFEVKGLPGFSLEFRREGGAVNEVAFFQPGRTALGKRKVD